jgi:predicted amidohydrolase YtcJ
MLSYFKGFNFVTASLATAILLASVGTVQPQDLPEEVKRQGYADTIFVNGKIVSMDDTSISSEPGSVYQALAVKRDSIMKLGTNAEIRALAADFTVVYDLNGRTMIPGIIETHSHIYGAALSYLNRFGIKYPPNEVIITPQAADNLEETQGILRDSIKEAVKTMDPGVWLRVNMRVHPSDPTQLDTWGDTRRLTTRRTIDEWAPVNPVVVRPGNRGTINSAALDILNEFLPGYSDSIRESMHMDEIGVDPAEIGWVGSVEMGVIGWELYAENVPLNILAQALKLRSEAFAASRAVTTFSSRIQFPKIMSGYATLAELGQMPIRFSVHYEVHRRPSNPIETRQLYRKTGVLQGIGDDYLWFDGVGSERWDSHVPEACLGDDIVAPPHIKERETCPKSGDLHWDTLKNALRAGWRLKGVHSVGVESTRRFIQMIDEAREGTDITMAEIRDGMFTIEHCDQIGKGSDILDQIKEYNIMISCDPNYMRTFEALIRDYGEYNDPEHLRKYMLPFKTWIESGINVVGQNTGGPGPFHSEWLLVRRAFRGYIWAPEESIDRVRALKLYTSWAGRYVTKADQLGTLEEGKWADLVILNHDYFTVPVDDILKIQSLMTMVGGRVISLNDSLAEEWNTPPVGEQFNIDMERVEATIAEANKSVPWVSGPVGGGDN